MTENAFFQPRDRERRQADESGERDSRPQPSNQRSERPCALKENDFCLVIWFSERAKNFDLQSLTELYREGQYASKTFFLSFHEKK